MISCEMTMGFASITDRLAHLGDAKWAVHIESRRRRDKGDRIIELTIGEPDLPPPAAVVEAAITSLRAGNTHYSGGRGTDRVLDAIAQKYSSRSGRKITPENVLYFPGAQSALYVAMMGLVEHGDEVIVADPLYATYEGVIRSTGADMVTVALHTAKAFHLDANDLEKVITPRSRVLLLNSPHNPTGATLSAEEIAEIVDVCEKHDLWIISDEVYEDMTFGAQFASPFDSQAGSKRTLVVSSISKSHMLPGFRSGWCVGPADFISRISPLSNMMLFGAQPFLQDATTVAIEGDFAECRAQRDALGERATAAMEALDKAPGVQMYCPQGGMFMMIDVGATGLDGEAFAWRLLEEENVAVMPGGSFGEMAKTFIRVSLGHDREIILEACHHIKSLAARLVGTLENTG